MKLNIQQRGTALSAVLQLRDPNPSAVLLVQYKNNYNLLLFVWANLLALAGKLSRGYAPTWATTSLSEPC